MSITEGSRRMFLGAGAAAALAPSLAWAGASGPRGKAHRLKVGLASYSTRKLTLDQTLDLCREADIAYINFKDVHLKMTASAEEIAAARGKIEAAGVRVMGGGTITFKNDPASVRANFEYARRCGFPLMVSALATDPATTPVKETFDLIEKMIREFDIKVALHNHGPEDKFFPAPQDAYRLLQGRDQRFGLCMDIGHTVRAGADPVKVVEECRDRLLDLHLKDLKEKTSNASQIEVGKGALDIPALLRALQKIGFTGHCALEYEINPDNPVVGIKESFSYLRGVLDAIEP